MNTLNDMDQELKEKEKSNLVRRLILLAMVLAVVGIVVFVTINVLVHPAQTGEDRQEAQIPADTDLAQGTGDGAIPGEEEMTESLSGPLAREALSERETENPAVVGTKEESESVSEIDNVSGDGLPVTEVAGMILWNDGRDHEQEDYSEHVGLTLFRKVKDSREAPVEMEGSIPEWTDNGFVYRTLPARDPAGNEYEYSVTETWFKSEGTGGLSCVVIGNEDGSFSVKNAVSAGNGSITAGNMDITKFDVMAERSDDGTCVITNTEYTEFEFFKVWTNGITNDPQAWPDGKTIYVTLRRRIKEGKETVLEQMATFAINKGNYLIFEANGISKELAQYKVTAECDEERNTYRYKITGLERTKENRIGDVWEYSLVEESSDEKRIAGYNLPDYRVTGTNTTYKSSPDGEDLFMPIADGGSITIYNRPITVVLPAGGGIGTTIFYMGGAILLVAALILLITKRRAGRRDEENDRE